MKNAIRLGALLALLALSVPAYAGAIHATLYKNPYCTCCEQYATYLRQNGFKIDVKPTNDLEQLTLKAGIPEQLAGCHTMFVDGYVVVGHVSADTLQKLLAEHPSIIGLAIPGMPPGVPGMGGQKEGPVKIYAREQGQRTCGLCH